MITFSQYVVLESKNNINTNIVPNKSIVHVVYSDRGVSVSRYSIVREDTKLNTPINPDFYMCVYPSWKEMIYDLETSLIQENLLEEDGKMESVMKHLAHTSGTFIVYIIHEGNHFHEAQRVYVDDTHGEWYELPINLPWEMAENNWKSEYEYVTPTPDPALDVGVPWEDIETTDHVIYKGDGRAIVSVPDEIFYTNGMKKFIGEFLVQHTPQLKAAMHPENRYTRNQKTAVKNRENFIKRLLNNKNFSSDSIELSDMARRVISGMERWDRNPDNKPKPKPRWYFDSDELEILKRLKTFFDESVPWKLKKIDPNDPPRKF